MQLLTIRAAGFTATVDACASRSRGRCDEGFPVTLCSHPLQPR
jgi:hypothetical protein